MREQNNSPEPLEEVLAAKARQTALREDEGRMVEALFDENTQLNNAMESADARLKVISEKLKSGIKAYEKMRADLSSQSFEDKILRLESDVEFLQGESASVKRERDLNAAIILKLLAIHETLFRDANFDKLTGLYNRAGFIELLKGFHEAGVRKGVFISLDADRFKSINDTYDHIVGNKVLVKLGEFLAQNFRARDPIVRLRRAQAEEKEDETSTVGRMGGEEILIFLPNTDIKGAEIALRRLIGKDENEPLEKDKSGEYVSIEIPFDFGNNDLEDERLEKYGIPKKRKNKITISGSALEINFPDEIKYWDKLLDSVVLQGEHWLYEAKESGRNRVYIVK